MLEAVAEFDLPEELMGDIKDDWLLVSWFDPTLFGRYSFIAILDRLNKFGDDVKPIESDDFMAIAINPRNLMLIEEAENYANIFQSGDPIDHESWNDELHRAAKEIWDSWGVISRVHMCIQCDMPTSHALRGILPEISPGQLAELVQPFE